MTQRPVTIDTDSIRLGQLLKLAGLAASGADARRLLEAGSVRVNGRPEVRRGRQLRPGDMVAVGPDAVRVARRKVVSG
ncbi:MAG: RNA-binding S4 domain-containing protein [Acidimicrobiales bacterium]